jgi:hypothetical protein
VEELSFDSIMAEFIHLDAAVDGESAEGDIMVTVLESRRMKAARQLLKAHLSLIRSMG